MAAVDSSSIITSVSPQSPQHGFNPELLSTVNLDLRGQRFRVDRDTLMNLPESVLLCLFPNGLVLSRMEGDEEEYQYVVDFDPHCFTFIINFFHRARDDFYGTPDSATPAPFSAQSALVDPSNPNPTEFTGSRNPILTKQAIIVLREELEYFAIPPSGARTNFTNEKGLANDVHIALKVQCGLKLLEKKSIFTALQRNVNKENNVAEQHLIDMLCMSGFNRDDEWGYRAMEPNRCCISSIALVLLKTGIIHGQNGEVNVDSQQMGTAQKLLLFWRKPARKCWWDGVEVEVPIKGGGLNPDSHMIKLWARRVWTLELSLI